MKIKINNKTYTVDSNSGIDISIPINFNSKENPKFYDSDIPKKKYYQYDGAEYSIKSGSGCNVPLIELNIHCMGTHTETANHISENGVTINMIKKLNFIPSQLITIKPERFTDESYHASKDGDLFITKSEIMKVIDNENRFLEAIIIRTLPNSKEKKTFDYNTEPHPYLTTDAIQFLKELNVKHILIDTPSIDRYDDRGKLGNHHIFFKDIDGKCNLNTITELIFVPNDYKDGKYFLSIGVPNFNTDAAPSRPILFPTDN